MDRKTACQIFLGSSLIAVTLCVLGLTADNISYVNESHGPMNIRYPMWNGTSQREQDINVSMNYLPSKISLGTMVAPLIAGLVCALVSAAIVVASWKARGTKALGSSFAGVKRHERSLPYFPTSIALAAIAFALSLAVAIYVWHPMPQWSRPLQAFLPIPYQDAPTTYISTIDFTPEMWNSFIAPYVTSASKSHRLQALSKEANAARILMIPMVVISAAMVLLSYWTWRQESLAAAAANRDSEAKDVEVVSIDASSKC